MEDYSYALIWYAILFLACSILFGLIAKSKKIVEQKYTLEGVMSGLTLASGIGSAWFAYTTSKE